MGSVIVNDEMLSDPLVALQSIEKVPDALPPSDNIPAIE
jgi:hypothetical protein